MKRNVYPFSRHVLHASYDLSCVLGADDSEMNVYPVNNNKKILTLKYLRKNIEKNIFLLITFFYY